jgi:hypothetical protein
MPRASTGCAQGKRGVVSRPGNAAHPAALARARGDAPARLIALDPHRGRVVATAGT